MRATIRLCLETRPCHQGHPAPRRGRSLSSPAVPAGPTIPVCRDGRGASVSSVDPVGHHPQSCERPSVGPAALLWSPCSEAARPACLAGRREHVPVRAASGSWAHWAPAGDGGPLPGAACGPLCTLCPGPPPSPAIKRYPPAPLAHHPCLCPVTTPPPAPAGSSWGPAGCGRDRTIAPS